MNDTMNQSRGTQTPPSGTVPAGLRRAHSGNQPHVPLRVKEYMLTPVGEDRLCVLRWVRTSDMDEAIDSVAFSLTQLDGHGGELSTRVLRLSHIPKGQAGCTFAPNQGFPVERGCVAVSVKVLTVTVGNFVYRYDLSQNDGPVVEYCPRETWRYASDSVIKAELSEFGDQRVFSKRGRRVGFLWVMVAVTVILLLGMILNPYIDHLTEEAASLLLPTQVVHLLH